MKVRCFNYALLVASVFALSICSTMAKGGNCKNECESAMGILEDCKKEECTQVCNTTSSSGNKVVGTENCVCPSGCQSCFDDLLGTDGGFFKAGVHRVTVETDDSLSTGSKYGDEDLTGIMLGIGKKGDTANGGFYKIAAEVSYYGGETFNAATGGNATGGGTAYTYEWEVSTDFVNWSTAIPNVTTTDYTDNLTITETTVIRRKVTDNYGAEAYSNSVILLSVDTTLTVIVWFFVLSLNQSKGSG